MILRENPIWEKSREGENSLFLTGYSELSRADTLFTIFDFDTILFL